MAVRPRDSRCYVNELAYLFPIPEYSASYLVNRVDDPVDAGIATDSLVLRVDQDDFKVLVGRVLVNPVRVQDAQVGAATANTLLGGGAERALVLELVDTLVGGLACRDTHKISAMFFFRVEEKKSFFIP